MVGGASLQGCRPPVRSPSGVAQLAERLTVNQRVVGSSPTPGAARVRPSAPRRGSFRVRSDARGPSGELRSQSWIVRADSPVMTEVDSHWVPERSDPTGPDRAALIEDLPDAVLVMDHQARLLWGNRAAEDLFGRSLEESVGLDCITLVHPSDLEMALLSLAGMQTERVGRPLELRVSTPEGWRRMELVGHSRADDIILVFRDLTDRHRWEVASDNLDVLRTVLQHISTVVLVIELDGRVRSSSAALTRLLGLDQLEVEGRHLSGLVSSDDRVAVGRAIREALDAPVGASVAVDVGARRADDSFLPVTFSLVNLVDDPTVGGLVMTVHD